MDTYLRRSVRRFLTHTYTWIDAEKIPVLEDGEQTYDEYDQPIYRDADPVEEKPCLFLYEEVATNDPTGPVNLKIPTLYVLPDDEIEEKDGVINILDRTGNVLLASAFVETVDPTAEINGSVLRVLRLSGAVTV